MSIFLDNQAHHLVQAAVRRQVTLTGSRAGASRHKRRTDQGGTKLSPLPDITTIVNVALVLLIIFMIVTPMIREGVQVETPQVEAIDQLSEQDQSVVLSIQADAQKGQGEGYSCSQFIVNRSLPWKAVAKTSDQLRALGIARNTIATDGAGSMDSPDPQPEPKETYLSLHSQVPVFTLAITEILPPCGPDEFPSGGPCSASCWLWEREAPARVPEHSEFPVTELMKLLEGAEAFGA